VSHVGVFRTDFILIFYGIVAVAVAICLGINKKKLGNAFELKSLEE